MRYRDEIKTICTANLDALEAAFQEDDALEALDDIVACVIRALSVGNKIMLCGNGGSAADAQHIAAEFIGRFKLERQSYPAIALTTDSSILTCVANDYSFEDVFVRQVEGLGRAGDVLIGISTSGNSENVIRAVKRASALKIKTVSFTGHAGGKLKGLTDFNFTVDSADTPTIQAGHGIALHAMCEIVEKELIKN